MLRAASYRFGGRVCAHEPALQTTGVEKPGFSAGLCPMDAAKARLLDPASLTTGVLLLLQIALFLGDRQGSLFGIGQGLFRRLLAEQGFLESLRPLQ